MKQEIANTPGRFSPAEIRSLVARDKGGKKAKTENRAKPPTAKGTKFPDLAGTRPKVSNRSTAKKAPADTSVTNAKLRLLELQSKF